MLHDHVGERCAIGTDTADRGGHGDGERLFTGPPGIPLDAFWALVDPERETARDE